jgi:hypothetical protein
MSRTSFTTGEIVGGFLITCGLILTVWAQSIESDHTSINDGVVDNSSNPMFLGIQNSDSTEFEDEDDESYEMSICDMIPPPPPTSSTSTSSFDSSMKLPKLPPGRPPPAGDFTSPPRYIRKGGGSDPEVGTEV